MNICPRFFIHKWDAKPGKSSIDLMIDYPSNIKSIISSYESSEPVRQLEEANERAFEGTLTADVLTARQRVFKDQLVALTYDHCMTAKQDLVENNPNMFNELYGHLDQHITTQWPDYFDPHSVAAISQADLDPKPVPSKTVTYGSYLNKYDIRGQLESSMQLMREQSESKSCSKVSLSALETHVSPKRKHSGEY